MCIRYYTVPRAAEGFYVDTCTFMYKHTFTHIHLHLHIYIYTQVRYFCNISTSGNSTVMYHIHTKNTIFAVSAFFPILKITQ